MIVNAKPPALEILADDSEGGEYQLNHIIKMTDQKYGLVRDSTIFSGRTAQNAASISLLADHRLLNSQPQNPGGTDNPAERWKPFPTQQEHLQISSLGRIADRQTGELQPTSLHPDGYECIWLTQPHTQRPLACSVHWAVAMAFLPNPLGLPFVKHLDTNPFNNQASNLIWSGMPTTDPFSLTFCRPSSHD